MPDKRRNIDRRQGVVLVALAVFFPALVGWLNRPGSELQSGRSVGLPFGCIPSPHGGYAVQDFAYNLIFLHGISQRDEPRPYRQEDQEKLIRRALPSATSGMSHAYSPVALVVAQPFLALPPPAAYLAFSLLAALATLLLYGLDLLPRTEDRLQVYLLIVCAVSVTEVTAFAVGQTALATTPLLGAVAWCLRHPRRRAWIDLVLGVLTWVLCLKPSLAVIPVALLLGARAWRALGITTLLLAMTWLALGPLYGGWWQGLVDYETLLGHYDAAGMIPFMREVFTRHGDTGANAFFSTLFPAHSALFFTMSRVLYLTSTALLLALRWTGRIDGSQHLRAMIWTFLMLCPYLLPSEDTILCLLIVEGAFFRSRSFLRDGVVLLFMLAIMNLRAGLTYPGQINFPLKCALLAWIALEAVRGKWRDDRHDRPSYG